jgi:hypothetical protein
MPRSRLQLRRTSRIALLVALGSGLGQGAAVVAGYITGLEGRFLAVFALAGVTSLIALAPGVLQASKKNMVLAQLPQQMVWLGWSLASHSHMIPVQAAPAFVLT